MGGLFFESNSQYRNESNFSGIISMSAEIFGGTLKIVNIEEPKKD